GGSMRLYQALKDAGVLVIPGDTCFFGLDTPWDHAQQCVRISYAHEAPQLQAAAKTLGRVARSLYA
ncbi:MAG: valine--pyruvate transaminase, partial [Pseudomonadota bacterium]|nr:valine--pyruvate transaminase [Pseudomonadota bacterium]